MAIACRPATPAPHEEGLGGRHGSRRRHHHRQGLVVLFGGIDHGAVAGKVGLARQDVHHLGAGNARHELHGEGDGAGLCQGLDILLVSGRIHDRDHGGALGGAFKLGGGRPLYAKHDVGTLDGGLAGLGDGGARFLVVGVASPGMLARARMHRDICAKRDELAHRFGRRGDARLGLRGFAQDSDLH